MKVDVLNVTANTVNIIQDREWSKRVHEEKVEEKQVPETATKRGTVKTLQCLLFVSVVFLFGFPLMASSMQFVGTLQAVCFAGAVISLILLTIPFEVYLDLRYYCAELSDSQIDDEIAGRTVSGYDFISHKFPHLKDVRLSKTLSKKQKVQAANEVAKKYILDWLFWTLVGTFVVCSVLWLFFPLLKGTGTATEINHYISSFYS